jgi:hypothetical protein
LTYTERCSCLLRFCQCVCELGNEACDRECECE